MVFRETLRKPSRQNEKEDDGEKKVEMFAAMEKKIKFFFFFKWNTPIFLGSAFYKCSPMQDVLDSCIDLMTGSYSLWRSLIFGEKSSAVFNALRVCEKQLSRSLKVCALWLLLLN